MRKITAELVISLDGVVDEGNASFPFTSVASKAFGPDVLNLLYARADS